MLEKQLAVLLAHSLSCYIRDLNEEQIQVSLWSGNLVLKDVHLKPDILEQIVLLILQSQKRREQDVAIHLSDASHTNSFAEGAAGEMEDAAAAQTLLMPFTVVKGIIRELTFCVPWATLDQDPVSVEVRGVELVFAPLRGRPFNPEEEEARQGVILRNQLNVFEKERDAANVTIAAECREASGGRGLPQTFPAVGSKTGLFANDKKTKTPSEASFFGLGRCSTAMAYVEKLVQPFACNAHLVIRSVSIQYIFDYPGLHPTLSTALSIFVDEVSVAAMEESFGKHFAEDFSASQSRAVTVKGFHMAVHAMRASRPKPTTPQKEDRGLPLTKPLALKSSPSKRTAAERGAINTSDVLGNFQCFCKEWEHTEVLVEISDALLNVKVDSEDSEKLLSSQKDTQKEYSKDPHVVRPYDSSLKARTVLEVSFGSLVRSQASFGALLALKALACSFEHGLVGAPYRKYLYLLDQNDASNLGSSRAHRQWRFALACMRDVLQKQKQCLYSGGSRTGSALKAVMDFSRVRRLYCGLFKRQHRVPWLPPLDLQERNEIIRLERQLTIEQILFLRCLSRAELGMETELNKLQRQWIASAASLRTKPPILSSTSASGGDMRVESATRRRLLGWFRWGGNEQGQSTASGTSTDSTKPSALNKETKLETPTDAPNLRLSEHKACLLRLFHLEWDVAKRYLGHLSTDGFEPTNKTLCFSDLWGFQSTENVRGEDGSSATQCSGLGLLLLVRCKALEVWFLPRYWTAEVDDISTVDSFFSHLEQKLHVRVSNIEWFSDTVQEPQDDRSGFSFFVKSFSACFSGTFNTPLLQSCERNFPQKQENEDFLVLKRNATCTRMTVVVSPFLAVLRPTHEMLWWSKEIFQFWSVMGKLFIGTSFSTTSSTSQADHLRGAATGFPNEELPVGPPAPRKPFPLLSLTLASFDVLVPLFLNDIASSGLNLKDYINCNPYLHSSELESHQTSTVPESYPFTQPPCNTTEIELVVGPPFETETKLASGSVRAVRSNQNSRSELLSPSFSYTADQSQFFGEPYLVLSVPCVALKTAQGPQKHYEGPEEEVMITIGENLRGVRFYCQPGSLRHRRLSPTSTLEILYVSSISTFVNPSEVSIAMYNGTEVNIEPHVIALLNDRLLRPCILYDAEHLPGIQSIIDTLDREWKESPNAEGVPWHFASPEELWLGKNDATVIPVPRHHGREYATLLCQWMAEHHGALARRTSERNLPLRVNDSLKRNTQPAFCWGNRTYSFCLEFARVFLRNLAYEDVVVAELMRPTEIPLAFMEYRRSFSTFSGEPYALEMMVSPLNCSCFGLLTDVSITNGANKSLSTIQSFCVHSCSERSASVNVDHLSVYLREELVECVELILATAKTFAESPLLWPQLVLQPSQKAAASNFFVSSRLLDMLWKVEFNRMLVELPYSKLMDYPYRALSVVHKNFQITCKVENQIACMEVSGCIDKGLRIEEDVAFEEVLAPFVVLGPSVDLSGPSEHLGYNVSLRWPMVQTLADDTEGPELHFRVSGGHIAIYMPFIMQSIDSVSSSFYAKLLSVRDSLLVWHGLSLSPHVWPPSLDIVCDATDDLSKHRAPLDSSFSWSSMQIHGTVCEIDVLLASNFNLPIDISDESTYFYLHVGELCLRSTRFDVGSKSHTPPSSSTSRPINSPQGSISIDVRKISYLPFRVGPPSSLLLEVGLVLTPQALLEPREDLTGYKYTISDKSVDFTLLVDVHPVGAMMRQDNMGSKGHPQLPSRAVDIDIVMLQCRMKTLLDVIKFNFMASSFFNVNGGSICGATSILPSNSIPVASGISLPQPDIPQHDTPRASLRSFRLFSTAPSSGFAIMLTMPSLCLGIITHDQQLISLKVLSGIQYYCARGGKWTQHVVINLQIRDLIIDAVNYETAPPAACDTTYTPCNSKEASKGKTGADPITNLASASLVPRPLLEVCLMGVTMILAENASHCGQLTFPFHIEGLVEDVTAYIELDLCPTLVDLVSDFMAQQPPCTNALGNPTVTGKHRPQHISENVSYSESEAAALDFSPQNRHCSQFSSSSSMGKSFPLGRAVPYSEVRVSLKNAKVVLKEPWEDTKVLLVLPKCSSYCTHLNDSSVQMGAIAIEPPSLLVSTNPSRRKPNDGTRSTSLIPVLEWKTARSPSVAMSAGSTESFISFSATLNSIKKPYLRLAEVSRALPTLKVCHRVDLKTQDLHIYCDLVRLPRLVRFVSKSLIPAFEQSVQRFSSRSYEVGSAIPFTTTREINAGDAGCPLPVSGTVSCEVALHRVEVHFASELDSREGPSNRQWGLRVQHLSAITAADLSKADLASESPLPQPAIAREGYMLRHLVKVSTSAAELYCGVLYPISLPSFSVEASIPLPYYIFVEESEEATNPNTCESEDAKPVCNPCLRCQPLSSVVKSETYVIKIFMETAPASRVFVSPNHILDGFQIVSSLVEQQAQAADVDRDPSEGSCAGFTWTGHGEALVPATQAAQPAAVACFTRTSFSLVVKISDFMLSITSVGTLSRSATSLSDSNLPLDVASLQSLAKLYLVDPLVVCVDQDAHTETVRMNVLLTGNFIISNGSGTPILFQHSLHEPFLNTEKEPTQMHTSSSARTIDFTSSVDCSTQRVALELSISNVALNLGPGTHEFILCMSQLVRCFLFEDSSDGGTSNTSICNNENFQPPSLSSPAGPLLHSQATWMSLSVKVHSFGLYIENVAMLLLRSIHTDASMLQSMYSILTGSPKDDMPSQTPLESSCTVSVGEVLLLQEGEIKFEFLRMKSTKISVKAGHVNIEIAHLHLNNYNAASFTGLMEHIVSLTSYAAQRIGFSQRASQNQFGLNLHLLLGDTRARLYCLHSPLLPEGYVEACFPNMTFTYVSSALRRKFALEVEHGVLSWVPHPVQSHLSSAFAAPNNLAIESLILVTPINGSLLIEEDMFRLSQIVNLRFCDVQCILPIGSTLQNCVDAVAQFVLPLFSLLSHARGSESLQMGCKALFSSRNGSEAPDLQQDKVYIPYGSNDSASDDDRAPYVKHANHPIVFTNYQCTIQTQAIDICLKSGDEGKAEVNFMPRELFLSNSSTLLSVRFQRIQWDHSVNFAQGDTVRLQIGAISSTVHPALQGDFVMAQATYQESTSCADSAAALYVRRRTTPSSATQSQTCFVMCRMQDFSLVVSTNLLSLLNNGVLAHLSVGVSRARAALGEWETHGNRPPKASLVPTDSNPAIHNIDDREGHVITIHTDTCLRHDLSLGGHHGKQLHFVKGSFLGRSPLNTIRVSSTNQARLLLFPSDLSQGVEQAPILIDKGLTVVMEDTPLVLHGINGVKADVSAVQDYAVLGSRSLLVVPEELVMASDIKTSQKVVQPLPSMASPSNGINTRLELDVLLNMRLQLQSLHQNISVDAKVSAQYCVEKRARPGTPGGSAVVVDECGEVILHHLTMASNSERITTDPIQFTLNVQFHRSSGDDAKPDFTAIRGVLLPVKIIATMGHLRLLIAVLNLFLEGRTHVKTVMGLDTETRFGESRVSRTAKQRKSDSEGEASETPSMQAGLTIPSVVLVLLDNFSKPQFLCSVRALACQLSGRRDFSSLSCRCTGVLILEDYPAMGLPLRTLVRLSPELTMDYVCYASGGVSLTGCLSLPESFLRFPVVTLLKLMKTQKTLQDQCAELSAFFFRNELGVPLVLTPVEASGIGLSSRTAPIPSCSLPVGSCVKADLLHYSQMSFRVMVDGKKGGSAPQDFAAELAGTKVDISALEQGTTYRFPLHELSFGVMDAVMRFDEATRLIRITTSVSIRNDMTFRTLSLPGDGQAIPLLLPPMQSSFVQLETLKHRFKMQVDEYALHDGAFLPFQSIIGPFLLLSDLQKAGKVDAGKTCSGELQTGVCKWSREMRHRLAWDRVALTDSDALILPVALNRNLLREEEPHIKPQHPTNSSQIIVNLIFKKKLARETQSRTARLLPKSEIEVVVGPVVSILNCTGYLLRVELFVPVCNDGLVVRAPAGPVASFDSVARSALLSHGERFEWYPDSPEVLRHAPYAKLELHSCGKAPQHVLRSLDHFSLSLEKECFLGMQSDEGLATSRGALIAQRLSETLVVIRGCAVLVNQLPVPVRPLGESLNPFVFGGESQDPVPGDTLLPGQQYPLLFPCDAEGKPPTRRELARPLRVRVAAGSSAAKASQPFACPSVAVPVLLSSEDSSGEWIFMVFNEGVDAAATVFESPEEVVPTLSLAVLKPVWTVRNAHASLALRLRFVGLHHDEDVLVWPLQAQELCRFGLGSHGNPDVSFRFETLSGPDGVHDQRLDLSLSFEWTAPFRLVSLAESALSVTVKHRLCMHSNDEKDETDKESTTDAGVKAQGFSKKLFAQYGVHLFTNTCTPKFYKGVPEEEAFACFTLTPLTNGHQCAFYVTLSNKPALVIENRTSYTVQFDQRAHSKGSADSRDVSVPFSSQPALGFIALPYTDVATCWEVASLSPPVVRIVIDTQRARSQGFECTVNFEKALTAKGAIKVGNIAFVLVNQDYQSRCFFISITENRMLESQLLFQPRFVVNLNVLAHSLSVVLASICVPDKTTHLSDTTFESSFKQWQTNTGASIAAEFTDAEKLSLLKVIELDVVRICITSLLTEVSWNERHAFTELHVSELSIIDCTSPAPTFSTVLYIGAAKGGGSPSKSPLEGQSPCLSLRLHLLQTGWLFSRIVGPLAFEQPPICGGTPSANQGHTRNAAEPSTHISGLRLVDHQNDEVQADPASIPIEELRFTCSMAHICLHDDFLYVVLQATESVVEAHRLSQLTPSMCENTTPLSPSARLPHQPTQCQGLAQKDNALKNASLTKRAATLYDFRVAKMYVSPMSLCVSLKRRTDSRFSPYEGLVCFPVPSVEEALLRINEFRCRDISQRSYSPWSALFAILWPSYRLQLILQFYKVIGALEVIGYPIATVNAWGRGVRSLLKGSAPHDYLSRTEKASREVISSTMNSFGLLSQVGGRTLAPRSLDRRGTEKAQDPEKSMNVTVHATEVGVLSGVSPGNPTGTEGVLREPLPGARASGVTGLLVGMTSGMMDLATRPISGILQGIGGTAELYTRQRTPGNLGSIAKGLPALSSHVTQHKHLLLERNFSFTDRPSNEVHALMDSLEISQSVLAECEGRSLLSTDSLKTCEFISIDFYNCMVKKVTNEFNKKLSTHELSRAVIGEVGAHNYALHASYHEFLRDATPEEFYHWVHIALDAHLAQELGCFLDDLNSRQERGDLGEEAGRLDTEYKKDDHRIKQMQSIKASIGVSNLLKHASVDELVEVCTLEEIKANVSIGDFQLKFGMPLLIHRCTIFKKKLKLNQK